MSNNEHFIVDFNRYLRTEFGERIWRVALDAGMTCPNRDGSIAHNGCIYCDNQSFNPLLSDGLSILDQLQNGIERVRKRHGVRRVLAYYQTFTNTYGAIEQLESAYQPALEHEAVAGIMIGTRPDCLPSEVINLLCRMNRIKPIWVELGVQTIHDRTLVMINRGHSWAVSNDAIQRLRQAGLRVAAHVILGLPGETEREMIATGMALAALRIDGLKLHHMHAVKGTRLASMYESGEWVPLDEISYIRIAARFLSAFQYPLVLMRWTGDCPSHLLVAPHWQMSKSEIRSAIEAQLEQLQAR